MAIDILDVRSIRDQTTSSLGFFVFLTSELGEAPLVGDDDLLATGELVLAAAQGFNDDGLVGVLGTDRDQGLANVDTGDRTNGLTERTTHTSLQTIGTSTAQHLVNTQDMEGMDTNTHVEPITTSVLGDVLVSSDTGSFQGFRADLFALVGDQVHAEGEFVAGGLLAAQVEDTDLGIGDTAAVAGLGVRLVLAVAIATSRTTTHL